MSKYALHGVSLCKFSESHLDANARSDFHCEVRSHSVRLDVEDPMYTFQELVERLNAIMNVADRKQHSAPRKFEPTDQTQRIRGVKETLRKSAWQAKLTVAA